jgi:hypothetical protein
MIANDTNIGNIKKFLDKYAYHDVWSLSRVWYDERTNSIKARFRNETVGRIQGTVRLDFSVRSNMQLNQILENIAPEVMNASDFIADMFENMWEDNE